MAKFNIRGVGPVTLDLRRMVKIRALVERGEVTEAMARDMAFEVSDYIRENWSGYVPPRSSPGRPPAVDTGELDEGIEAQRERANGRLYWSVRSTAPHTNYMEYGTVRIAPRPFMAPAAEWARGRYAALAKNILLNSLKVR